MWDDHMAVLADSNKWYLKAVKRYSFSHYRILIQNICCLTQSFVRIKKGVSPINNGKWRIIGGAGDTPSPAFPATNHAMT